MQVHTESQCKPRRQRLPRKQVYLQSDADPFLILIYPTMEETIERNLGEQPIAKLLQELQLRTHDLVAASDEHITHKMVTKACKGRRLTKNIQNKIVRALNKASHNTYKKDQLFNY
jgi:hypothetical protein